MLSVVCLGLHDLLGPVRDAGVPHITKDVTALLGYIFVVTVVNQLGSQRRQAVFEVPDGVNFVSSPDGVVVTMGRLAAGASSDVHLTVGVDPSAGKGDILTATAGLRSSTALPVEGDEVRTRVSRPGPDQGAGN